MKTAEAVLAVKFNSIHSTEELMERCQNDLGLFASVPGLMQKYYLSEESTGAISGIYLFDTKQSRAGFWRSGLAKGIPSRYGVISETLRVEEYGMAIVLHDKSPMM